MGALTPFEAATKRVAASVPAPALNIGSKSAGVGERATIEEPNDEARLSRSGANDCNCVCSCPLNCSESQTQSLSARVVVPAHSSENAGSVGFRAGMVRRRSQRAGARVNSVRFTRNPPGAKKFKSGVVAVSVVGGEAASGASCRHPTTSSPSISTRSIKT